MCTDLVVKEGIWTLALRQGSCLPSLFPEYMIVSLSWKHLLCRVPEGRAWAEHRGAGGAVPNACGSALMKNHVCGECKHLEVRITAFLGEPESLSES